MKSIRLALQTVGVAGLLCAGASGQALTADQQKNMQAMMDAARKDLRTDKQSLLDQAMRLEAADKTKFWGIYEGYQKELDTIWDMRLANIKSYAETYQSMTEPQADQLARTAMNNEKQVTALKEKYYGQFKAALGPKIAARWLQAETALNSLAMLQILSRIPLLQ